MPDQYVVKDLVTPRYIATLLVSDPINSEWVLVEADAQLFSLTQATSIVTQLNYGLDEARFGRPKHHP